MKIMSGKGVAIEQSAKSAWLFPCRIGDPEPTRQELCMVIDSDGGYFNNNNNGVVILKECSQPGPTASRKFLRWLCRVGQPSMESSGSK